MIELPEAARPAKHQLLLQLDDGRAVAATIQMYGGLYCAPADEMDNPYVLVGRTRPSPLSDAFDEAYFAGLLSQEAMKGSAKAFLATEQRIPGLGNGVLQDILWRARVNPRTRMRNLDNAALSRLYHSVREVLAQMVSGGGRDTETDLHGRPGGYATRMSKANTAGLCPECGAAIVKEAYLGGSVYYCPVCQPAG